MTSVAAYTSSRGNYPSSMTEAKQYRMVPVDRMAFTSACFKKKEMKRLRFSAIITGAS